MQGTPQEIASNFNSMKEEITKTSLATGKSTEEIANAIKKFATIGFNFKDSMAGGLEATKLSIVLFGDAGETAETFARSLKLLMDTSAGAKSAQEQFAETMSLVSELEKTNQFELNEVNESLIRFAPAAKAAGFSARETLSVLAALGTAGLAGSRGGTLLSSSVNKLKQNLDLLVKELGIQVNPQLDTTFSILTKVLDAIEKVQGTDKMGVGATKAIAEIFGGEKGSKTITALVGVNKQLKENLKILPDVNRTMKDMGIVLDSTSGKAGIATNSFKEFKKALIEGLTSGNDFKNIIGLLATGMQKLAKNGKNIGNAF
jgi:TP901 family phage tail tape measure protein